MRFLARWGVLAWFVLLPCVPMAGEDAAVPPVPEAQLLAGAAVGQIQDEAPESYGFLEGRLAFGKHPFGSWVAVEFAGPARYYGVGLYCDLVRKGRMTVSISLGPGFLYGDGGRKLGHEMEFRSAIELWYRMESGFRFGTSLCHYSNGGLGKVNPGEESVRVFFAVPIRWGRRG